MKPEKAESLLTWWAQVKFDGVKINGFASEAAFCSFGGVSVRQSRPLINGDLCDDWATIDRILKDGGMSPLQYLATFVAFVPLRVGGRYMNCRERAAAAGCSLGTLKLAKEKAIKLLKSNASRLYRSEYEHDCVYV